MLRNRKKRIKEKLLSEFGNLKPDSFYFDYIESYFQKKDHATVYQTLSDKTCNDLDFQELFMFIDSVERSLFVWRSVSLRQS